MTSACSKPDPYMLSGRNQALTFQARTGRTQRSSVISTSGLGVFVTLGQSLLANGAAQGTYTATNAASIDNLDVCDGAVYAASVPLLSSGSTSNTNSPNIPIADMLITRAVYSRVILAPIGIGGASAAEWAKAGAWGSAGYLNERIGVTCRRLANLGLTPTAILWQQGQADASLGTAGATYTAQVKSVAQTFRDEGMTAPMFVAVCTMLSGSTNATIQTAQGNCVDGPLNIVAGPDMDTAVPSGDRYDGTHYTETGNNTKAADAWADTLEAYF